MKKLMIPSFAVLLLLAACQAQTLPVAQTPPAALEPQQPQPQVTHQTQPLHETPAPAPSVARVIQPTGNFHYDETVSDYIGTLYLQGSVKIVEMSEGFCEENCKKFKYAFLNYDSGFDAENADLKKFMGMNEGNSFAGGNDIGLGCVENQTIRRMAFEADQIKEFTIGQTEAGTILGSSESKPVVLKLNRPAAVPGMGAPDCYTHFTGIELVQFADNV